MSNEESSTVEGGVVHLRRRWAVVWTAVVVPFSLLVVLGVNLDPDADDMTDLRRWSYTVGGVVIALATVWYLVSTWSSRIEWDRDRFSLKGIGLSRSVDLGRLEIVQLHVPTGVWALLGEPELYMRDLDGDEVRLDPRRPRGDAREWVLAVRQAAKKDDVADHDTKTALDRFSGTGRPRSLSS